jgi:hypothetical protein
MTTDFDKDRLLLSAARVLAPRAFKGLCATCDHALTCRIAHQADTPILFCELFEDNVPDGERKTDSGAGYGEAGPFKGLCINCDSRHICAKAKSPEVVHQCEEYS